MVAYIPVVPEHTGCPDKNSAQLCTGVIQS